MLFENRKAAGGKLASALKGYLRDPQAVVIGLARGGVVVAAQLANELNLPYDLVVVRKVGAPDNPELGLGAVSVEGEGVFNDELIALLGISQEFLLKEIERERELVQAQKVLYAEGSPELPLEGKTVILVDDGIATGASMKVAIESLRMQLPEKIVMAVPVAPKEALDAFALLVDEVVCLATPSPFGALGAFYIHFDRVTDEEFKGLLQSRSTLPGLLG